MKKRWIYVVAIIFVIIFAFVYQNYADSKISDEMAEQYIEEYEIALTGAYGEIDEQFSIFKKSGDYEGWKAYSSEWLVEISNSKSANLEKDYAEIYSKRVKELDACRKMLYDVWSDYNKDIKGTHYNKENFKKIKEQLEELLNTN